jgi:hypothetical protein
VVVPVVVALALLAAIALATVSFTVGLLATVPLAIGLLAVIAIMCAATGVYCPVMGMPAVGAAGSRLLV